MTKFLCGLILLSLAVACGDGFEKDKPKKQRSQEAIEVDTRPAVEQYMELVNNHRIKLRLQPLTYHLVIEEIAKTHSKGMALHTRPFGHMGMNQRCRKLKRRVGRHTLCGEIVAQGQKNASEVFKAWMKSPKHREIIEQADYTMTGLGIYKNQWGVTYWTQMFIEL